MKILVIGGGGRIGSAVAWDLAHNEAVTQVGVSDLYPSGIERTLNWVKSPKLVGHQVEILDRGAAVALLQQYDAAVICVVNRKASYQAVEAAIEAGVHAVDILEEYHRRPDQYETEGLILPEGMDWDRYGDWLHEQAQAKGVTILDGMGFAPGLSNVAAGEGIRKLDKAESVVARVGGIPAPEIAEQYPLRYIITWSFEHVLREYMVKVNVRKNGEVVEVEATTELEPFQFTEFGKDEALECAVTPGMPSFIFTRPELKEFSEKTVRWPGHWQGILTLKECGMLDLEPVEVPGGKVSPRDVVAKILSEKLQPKNPEHDVDVCVMWTSVTGEKDGKRVQMDYHLWMEADPADRLSAMARTTAFPAAIGAVMLAEGRIKATGIVPPEDGIDSEAYPHFVAELAKRDIIIGEKMTVL
ncbi:MAG TPA: saccharopine dehydrogenase C-terminal domain-containing protein [Anaerolineae bacterium]|nr:saccharopine dehydrogenase C-terminal domain-containing protein [Anaerolineae bacterium]